MFTVWILNKNKKEQSRSIGDEIRMYRNREKEVLFMDLRQMGEPFEKKFIQFSDADIKKIADTYHTWQNLTPTLSKGEGEKIGIIKIFLNIVILRPLTK